MPDTGSAINKTNSIPASRELRVHFSGSLPWLSPESLGERFKVLKSSSTPRELGGGIFFLTPDDFLKNEAGVKNN